MKQKFLSKWVFAGAALLLGLTACNNKNEDDLAREKGYDTYSTISLSLPASLRAGEDDNYNKQGTYEGIDHIKSLTLYMIDNADPTAKPELQHFPETSLHLDGATGKVTMAPFRTKSGNKTVYAVINITDAIKAALDAANNETDFKAAYEDAYEAFGANPIAQLESGKDVIVMSGKPVTQDIKPNISALNAPAVNNVHITLTRSAARVSVTTTATETAPGSKVYEVKATVTGGTTKTFGTISNLVWSVGQFEKKFYLLQKSDRKSPSYDWITNGDYTTEAPNRYDYSQLRSGKFFDVEKITTYGIDQVKTIKYKYISETTHKDATSADPMTSGYRKGNTTYVLIKGQFTPDDEMWATGEKALWTPGDDLFYGLATQKFYSSQQNAETAGNATNKVVTYKKGMVFYFLWVNPNVVDMTKWAMSPVYRNNIYNVDIKSFQNIGLSGNPFNPDPDPQDPDKPDPDDPDNPKPEEPLPTEKTFMVATITITPWTWHNYSIDL